MKIINLMPSKHIEKILNIGSRTSSFAAGNRIIFWSPEVLEKWKKENGGPMLVAVDHKEIIVGFLLATFHTSGISTLENLYVDDIYRRGGIASILMRNFETQATENKMKILRSFSQCTNDLMGSFLKKNGYLLAALTQWFSINPKNVIAIKKTISDITIRQLLPKDHDKVSKIIQSDRWHTGGVLFSKKIKYGEWLRNSRDLLYGAFSENDNILGLIMISMYKPLRKATIEYFGCIDKYLETGILELLIGVAIESTVNHNVNYLSIHPCINQSNIINTITNVGFEKKRVFEAYTKFS